MTRYQYARQVTPPAPFVYVAVRTCDAGQELGDLPAQLDTGASRTVIPWRVVEHLGLVPLDQISVEGVGGHRVSMPTFLVQIQIRPLQPVTVEVAAHKDEPFVLLGRDVLNHFRIVLDGPQLTLEIS